jgi:enediyne biosynthesis protein E5
VRTRELSAAFRHDPGVRTDPRHYQIAMLAALLGWGLFRLDFDVMPAQAVVMLAGTLGTQWLCTTILRLPAFDARSPLISGLGLCLLLRTNSLTIAAVASVVTIASKFVIRRRGKHIFNPTNFSLVAMMLVTGQVWVSPGQWGSAALAAFLMAGLGGLVVNRAARSDVTYAFAAFYLALVFGRSLWFGEPMAIPMHRVQNGALLLFTFFMISDPKTTPDTRAGRVLFAALVAGGAYYVQYELFRTNGLLWALAASSPLVPIIDRLLPGSRYHWGRPATPIRKERHDSNHTIAPTDDRRPDRVWPGLVGAGGPRLLRLLRGQGRRQPLQPRVTGRARS